MAIDSGVEIVEARYKVNETSHPQNMSATLRGIRQSGVRVIVFGGVGGSLEQVHAVLLKI